jgi:hypothetical protein
VIKITLNHIPPGKMLVMSENLFYDPKNQDSLRLCRYCRAGTGLTFLPACAVVYLYFKYLRGE